MPFDAKPLRELLDLGLLPDSGSQSYLRSRHLAGLVDLREPDVRDVAKAPRVLNSVALLTRHIMPKKDPKDRVLDLFATYLILRGADDRAEVTSLSGPGLPLPQYQSYIEAVNPLRTITLDETLPDHQDRLSFMRAVKSTHTHPLFKHKNPFRDDALVVKLVQWWQRVPTRESTEAALLTALVALATRSQIMLDWLLKNNSFVLSGPKKVGNLYAGVVMKHGTLVGDGATIHASTTRLGTLIDTLAVPYWREEAEEPVRRLARASTPQAAASVLLAPGR